MTRLTLSLLTAVCLAFCTFCSAQQQDTNFSQGPQYLMNYGSPHFMNPISTPSLDLSVPRAESPNAPAAEHTGEMDSTGFGGLQSEQQVDQVYYGVQPDGLPLPPNVVIEVAPVEPVPVPVGSLPEIFNVGVRAIVNPKILREEGYGVSLAQAAAYWKAHKASNVRVFTNADIARFHRSESSAPKAD
ncbi:MAG TPA: hypothetical protein VMX38_21975 [Verrucomicrobiae bacterium]|jgi:hypothetical protein|nr:hypothetical protein [Verrucomicrobiae bacterium]